MTITIRAEDKTQLDPSKRRIGQIKALTNSPIIGRVLLVYKNFFVTVYVLDNGSNFSSKA